MESNIPVNNYNPKEFQDLYFSISCGKEKLNRDLLRKYIDYTSHNGSTLFHSAIRSKRNNIFEKLLNIYIKKNPQKNILSILNKSSNSIFSPIYYAVLYGDYESVGKLIDLGVNIYQEYGVHGSLFEVAASKGKNNVLLKLLLSTLYNTKEKINSNLFTKYLMKTVRILSINNDLEGFENILNHSNNLIDSEGNNPLHILCKEYVPLSTHRTTEQDFEIKKNMINFAINKGYNLTNKNNHLETPTKLAKKNRLFPNLAAFLKQYRPKQSTKLS